ncbi:MAG TPA: substrate-binding domain-containing protein [Candidatus Limnocylindrales bacterium]|nr:substrate-binding domain-containing protein [Candidatus Limnocylindrales bacterium]
MGRLRFLVSLMTNDNDFQIEQAQSAEQTARKHGVDCQILFADNDAITQSTQILKAIQASPDDRPDAIVLEPVGGTALPQVARAAVNAGIGWVVLNRDANYVSELRQICKAPVFGVSSDHLEIGRMQAKQCAALLPGGGTVLYMQGPTESPVAKDRMLGMQEAKPANIHLVTLKGQWTEDSAHRAVSSWLKLTTSQKTPIDMVSSQNDVMAIGVRKAFQEMISDLDRERRLQIPFTGVDGVPKTGQAWVRSGLLAATIFLPPNTGKALELLVEAIQHSRIPEERVLIAPVSIPPLEKLGPHK